MNLNRMKTFDDYQRFETPLSFNKAPLGERMHVGLVLLSTDHSLEREWSNLLRERVCTFSSRMHFNGNLQPDNLKTLTQGISNAASLIDADLPIDVMAFACTSASMIIGEKKITELMRIHRSDVPVTNPWTAVKAAFKSLGASKVAILSPYPSQVNYILYQHLLDVGIEVPAMGAFGIFDDREISTVSKASLFEALDQILPKSNADAIFLPCTNLRVVEHIQALEDQFQRPVISSNSALYWHVVQLADRTAHCPGYGILLNT